MTRAGRRAAFTLIELLIVIGIISILALIAVPNMLEAQARAKVSRVKNDLRVMATALESYCVDNNAYPTYHYVRNQQAYSNYSFHVGGIVIGIYNSPPFPGPPPLTSPIAYLSAIPKDVFGSRLPDEPGEANEFFYVNWSYALERFGDPVFEQMRERMGPWRVHSAGPDRGGPDSFSGYHIPYDATNGTISTGDIIRTQKLGQMI